MGTRPTPGQQHGDGRTDRWLVRRVWWSRILRRTSPREDAQQVRQMKPLEPSRPLAFATRVDAGRPTSQRARARLAQAGIVVAEAATRGMHHRGYWRLVRALGHLSDAKVVVRIDSGVLRVSLADPYWARLLAKGYVYEPEVAAFLRSIRGMAFDFVDVGANVGYWSVFVSGQFPESRVTAIEPNPAIFSELVTNAALNGDRFDCRRTAITPMNAKTVTLQFSGERGGHAAATAEPGHARLGYEKVEVPATTLDIIVAKQRRRGIPLLVKLDIEGLETAVLTSSDCTDDPGVCFIYEDHGQDTESPTTRWLLANDKHEIFFLRPEARPKPIRVLAELTASKLSSKVGYNCVAVPKVGPWSASVTIGEL